MSKNHTLPEQPQVKEQEPQEQTEEKKQEVVAVAVSQNQDMEVTPVSAEDAMRFELKQEIKQELREELEKELRRELVMGFGREGSSTWRRLLRSIRKTFWPTEKEVLVKELNHNSLLQLWEAHFSDAESLIAIEEHLASIVKQGERVREIKLHSQLVTYFRFHKRKKVAAYFILNTIEQLEDKK